MNIWSRMSAAALCFGFSFWLFFHNHDGIALAFTLGGWCFFTLDQMYATLSWCVVNAGRVLSSISMWLFDQSLRIERHRIRLMTRRYMNASMTKREP